MTQPTIGRRLYFHCMSREVTAKIGLAVIDPAVPCDAGIIYVHPDNTLNLQVTGHLGGTQVMYNVTLVEDVENKDPALEYWAEWMPYQVKVEAERAAQVTPQE